MTRGIVQCSEAKTGNRWVAEREGPPLSRELQAEERAYGKEGQQEEVPLNFRSPSI